uniref:Zinc finger and BTB domain-containing protein 25 n=1 Tax=Anser brachyrhynchus TaxID=132585 RepID=A0A8B9BX19_9AVES
MPSANSHSLCTWLDKYVKQHESGARNRQPLSASFFWGGLGKKSGCCCTGGSRSAAPSHLAPAAVRGNGGPFSFTTRSQARADGSGNFSAKGTARGWGCVVAVALSSGPRNNRAAPAVIFSTRSRRSEAGAARPASARLGPALPGPARGQEARGGSSAHPIRRAGSGRSRAEPGLRFRGHAMDTSGHSVLLLQQLNMQREFGFLCDCTVAIGDVYFKAHRAVLAAFSNYFKMIFIHQTSECIKIQPADIQPDIFSYLLHIMYTGKGPKQTVNQSRLEEGIRFLHADHLSHIAIEMNQVFPSEAVQSSNLYGIQISTAHKTAKERLGAKETLAKPGSRSSAQGDHPQLQLSLAIGLDDSSLDQQVARPAAQPAALVKPAEELPKLSVSVKQEKCDSEPVVSQSCTPPSPDVASPIFAKANLRVHLCHYCGERFDSRGGLREHLHTHVSGSLPFGVPASILESSDLGEVQPLAESREAGEGHRLGAFLLKEDEHQLEHPSCGDLEPLQIGQLSLISKDHEPVELNCNFSFSRKRKISCTICGRAFFRKSQLLEHMYTHRGKQPKYGRCQRLESPATPRFRPYGDSESVGKSPSLSQDHLDECILESDLIQESVDTILVE